MSGLVNYWSAFLTFSAGGLQLHDGDNEQHAGHQQLSKPFI